MMWVDGDTRSRRCTDDGYAYVVVMGRAYVAQPQPYQIGISACGKHVTMEVDIHQYLGSGDCSLCG